MTYKTILGTVPTFQSLAVAADQMAFVKKKKKTAKGFIKTGVKSIVGISLIQPTANIIAGM